MDARYPRKFGIISPTGPQQGFTGITLEPVVTQRAAITAFVVDATHVPPPQVTKREDCYVFHGKVMLNKQEMQLFIDFLVQAMDDMR